eukprot:scaffold15143_cov103-Isochrysis_galbana.AAC.1
MPSATCKRKRRPPVGNGNGTGQATGHRRARQWGCTDSAIAGSPHRRAAGCCRWLAGRGEMRAAGGAEGLTVSATGGPIPSGRAAPRSGPGSRRDATPPPWCRDDASEKNGPPPRRRCSPWSARGDGRKPGAVMERGASERKQRCCTARASSRSWAVASLQANQRVR